MAERRWTEMQSLAMDTRDKTLLVSAAAGSGKTATLTERIIRSILDEENPIEISDMLIVTFTKAAAAELRNKVEERLRLALAEDPGNERLQRQLLLLPGARISTIDSFCSDILRSNCDRVGVSPTYRIADEAEAQLMLENILDGLFSAIYEGTEPDVATPEEMEALAECLTNSKSEGDLAVVVRALYDQAKDSEAGVKIFSDLVGVYDPKNFTRVEDTPLGRHAMMRLALCLEHHKEVLSRALDDLLGFGSDKEAKRIDLLEEDLEFISSLSGAGYNDAHTLLCAFSPRKNVSGSKDPTLPDVTSLRNRFKEDVIHLAKDLFAFCEDEWKECFSGLYEILGVLCRLLQRVDRLFSEEKLRRSCLEYSDVSRYTYQCLWQDGKRTDVAISQAKLYSAIYVDEYQDVNMIQHKIFEAISTPTDRFMVGDIKQSIYGFRGGDPDIFAEMKKSFPKAVDGAKGDYATIFMSENFRCDKGIIDFTNEIFDKVFAHVGRSIGYEPADRLVFAKTEGICEEYRRPELCLLPFGRVDSDESEERLSHLVVAEKISELLSGGRLNDGTPIRPEHIAIIMRNSKGKAQLYKAALEEKGIDAVTIDKKDFFMNGDVLLAMCLLNSVDNPLRDVYLGGLMCSPLFDFSPDEMVLIKRAGGDTLWESLLEYCSRHPEFEKGADFVTPLNRYRVYAEGTPVDTLVARLYQETGILSLASRHGGKENLIRLYEYARSFEASSFKGLYNFINYVNGIVGRKNSFDKQDMPADADAVRIITAHSSKGLEFPIVFFVGAEEPIKRRADGTKRLFFDPRIGLGAYLRTPSGLSLVDNPTAHIIDDYTLMRSVEEEARVLYVILTRARERLYLVATPRKKRDAYALQMAEDREYLSAHAYYSARSHLDLIMLSSEIGPRSVAEFLKNPSEELLLAERRLDEGALGDDEQEEQNDDESIAKTEEVGTRVEKNADFYRLICRRFAFKYPNEAMTRLPEKLSVSALYPKILDDPDGDLPDRIEDRSGSRLKFGKSGILPSFATGRDEELSAKRGICTHLLFQFCDLERLYKNGAEQELYTLVEQRYLSKKDAELVRIDEVERFRSSRLLSQMRSAVRIWRELRFNVRLSADSFTTDPELKKEYRGCEILVQGVIDCLYEDSEGELHLVDYKTDRLTAKELASPELAAKKLFDEHSMQLGYYSDAVLRMFGKRPATVEVYSLPLGDTVDVMKK